MSSAADSKQNGAAKTARIPIKIVPAERAPQARLDPRQGAGRRARASTRSSSILREATAAHGLRGGVVPEHRRVLRQGHRDLHDHRRHVHPALPVLRRRARPARSPDAEEPRHLAQTIAALQLRLRRDHQRRPRRPPRRRRAALRRLHHAGPGTFAATAIEVLVPDFRGRLESRARRARRARLPDVMNHNLETVPRLYRQARPGADYRALAAAARRPSRRGIRQSRPSRG